MLVKNMVEVKEFNDFTLFDIFCKNNELILIMSINFNPINEQELIILSNNKILEFKEKYVKNCVQPILIFKYKYKNIDSNIVKIKYKNIDREFKFDFIDSKRLGTLALTTLFKDDYSTFTIFYDYYSKQGVEHFYMYYNGKIKKKIKKIFDYPNVTLIEWNFRYWNKVDNISYKWFHHAQIGQINHALYKFGKDNYDYMIFNDLDEYFNVKENKLINFVKNNNNISIFRFCNIWAKTKKSHELKRIPNKFMRMKDNLKYPKRSKNIYKTNDLKIIGIHEPYTFMNDNNKNNYIDDLKMFHFYDWSSNRRYMKIDDWKKISINY